MSIDALLKRLEGLEGIEASDLEELKSLSKPDDKAVRDAKATAARILEEKKKLQEKTAELEAELEATKTGGLSEVEKAQKELAKAQKAQEALLAELNQTKVESAKAARAYKLEKIGSKISFIDSIPADMRGYAITSAFQEVEDLDDEGVVESVLSSFRETHKGVLASETTARGSGSTGGLQNDVNRGAAKSPEKMTDSERKTYMRSQLQKRSSI